MAEPTPAAERPLPSQVLAMTLLVLLAWLPLVRHIELHVSLYIAMLLVLRVVSLRWPVVAPRGWLLLLLTLAGIVNAFSAYNTFFGFEGGTALLATMLALKLLEMKRSRDVRFAAVLFGFLLVTQFLFEQSVFLVLYLAVLLVLDFALMVDLTTRWGDGRTAIASALRKAGVLAAQALPLALVLFFLFPRLSAPLWNLPHPEPRGRTGMSDWMEPGSLTELVLSAEPAFRVWFEGRRPPSARLYWRGVVAWETDGRRWTGWPGYAPLGTAAPLVEADVEITYRVEMEPTGKRWLYALDMPTEVGKTARILGDYQVMAAKPVKDVDSYQATSALTYNTGELAANQRQAGTQLPPNVTDRMRALVASWRRDVDDDRAVVRKALQFFNEEPFYYSLAPPRLAANPADSFLFETRSGYCEHYAGSFALLMRVAGIPSRVLLGYLGGEYNPLGDYVLVRQSDAHAWVEVWLAGSGWVRVDPTSAVHPDRIDNRALFERLGARAPLRLGSGDVSALARWVHNLRLLGDAMETGWRTWVLYLSSERQQQVLRTLGLGHLREYGLVAALLAAASLVIVLLLAALTRTRRPQDALERIYRRFCKRLSRIGFPRRRGEGPRDYANRVAVGRPDLREPVEAFMALYLPLRYGSDDRSGDYRALERRLNRVRSR